MCCDKYCCRNLFGGGGGVDATPHDTTRVHILYCMQTNWAVNARNIPLPALIHHRHCTFKKNRGFPSFAKPFNITGFSILGGMPGKTREELPISAGTKSIPHPHTNTHTQTHLLNRFTPPTAQGRIPILIHKHLVLRRVCH